MNDETVERVALLPCPFCGGDASYDYDAFEDCAETVVVACQNCLAQGGYYPGNDSTSPQEAAKFWNARAAIAAMPGWQPIETAPRDGTWVLLYDDRFKHSESSYLIGYWHGPLRQWAGKANSKGRFPLWDEATHWQPLPPPPETSHG